MSGENQKEETIDMLHGPLAGKIFKFTIPIMLSGILQLLFNATDIIVVGRYVGSNALAAVGSTGSLINLLVNLLVGLSVGAAVATGFYFGAGKPGQVKETIHTAVAISLLGGVIFAVLGLSLSPLLLRWMDTPGKILEQAALYLKIYFLGVPAMAAYNFGSAILRSLGDTKHPLYYLTAAGVINVLLDLLLVIVFSMDVAGVAIATVASQAVSAVLTLRHLTKIDPSISMEWKKIRISRSKLFRILRVGLPAGIQSTIFSFSNVMIQSSINSFGELAVAGSSASSNVEGFVYNAMNSFYQSAQTFTSQNVGGRKYERISRVFLNCALMVTVTGLVLGLGVWHFGPSLLKIYLPGNEAAIAQGMKRMSVIATTYFLCGLMEVISGELRGMGESVLPMVVSLVGSCLLRIVWIATVFSAFRSLTVLYLSYPVSWILTSAAHLFCFFKVKKRLVRSMEREELAEALRKG